MGNFLDQLLLKLKNPPQKYRPVPFWSWNDKLEPEILKEQITAMYQAGIGGYFMHARGGLQTQYLSPDWFNCIHTCVKAGNYLGMDAWCYDEEGWPSGFAGGRVPALGESNHLHWLEIESIRPEDLHENDGNILGCYRLTQPENRIQSLEITETGDMPENILIIKEQSNQYYID
ncbi:MAG: hypothetical protein ACM3YE_16590, partial [Bacteroidota bacterium]